MRIFIQSIRSKLASRGFLMHSVRVSRFRFQTLFIYFIISLTTLIFVRYVYALSETTKQMPTDVPFNRGVSGALAGYDNDGGVVSVLAGEVRIATSSAWMDGGYLYKKTITLKNLSGQVLTASASAQVTVNTKALFDASKLQNDCDDLRVAFVATQSANLRMQLARSYTIASGATNCADSTATIVTFPRMEPLGIGVSDSNYELYYGNTNATVPNGTGYDILRVDGSVAGATLVCPFNGSTTCIGQSGAVTPTTATGAIRYSGGKGALQLDGQNDSFTLPAAGSLGGRSAWTIEFWINASRWGTSGEWIMSLGAGYLHPFNGLRWYLGFQGQGLNPIIYQTGSPTANTWTHFMISYDGSTVRTFANGSLVNSAAFSGTPYAGGTTVTFNPTANVVYKLDELRVSNIARNIASFTPSDAPFEADSNTVTLYHFDENGDDPRNTGKAIDASGNGNHGTITGAKYVGGLIGVDNSSSWSGAIGSQSYAAHSGIFIEEGTTNLITNPSFEHSTFNTNWSTNYFNYAVASATFTPSMAKRNSAGPFAAGPMVQGSTSSSWGYPSDNISWTRGTQISGDFYSNVDAYQGSVVLWWTPEYSSSTQYQPLWVSNYTYHSLFYVNGNLTFAGANGASHSVSLSPVAGTTYQIVARWDTKNTLDGTNYISISINDSHTFGKTSSFTAQTPNGSNCFGLNSCASEAAQGIIEGLTVYRRPLFDGTYGVNVGNGDEINQIYNSGTGRDPTLVTGSWDVVFALPTNASTGALATGTGNAWSHPHASNLLGGTNGKNGFMMDGTYTNDGWNLEQPAMLKYDDTTPTFTAGLAKRNSAGPFAAGVLLQSTYGATGGDVVDIGSGTNVAGNFNQTIDKDQGSIVFWITPERVTGSRQRVVDFAAGYIEIVNGKLWVGFTGQGFAHSTTLVVGNTYFVAVRWDTKNPLNGTNRVSFTVDGTTEYFGPSLTALNGSNLSLGIGYAIESAQAIIEGLTLYRRPLYDGTYGIDVGNGDEINQIYNSGTGKDPTLVTGSWDVVFALPTNASAGNITTGTGNAWSHPHASNLLYTSTTNTGGFMLNGTYTTDSFSDIGTPTSVGALATGEKIFSGGYKYISDAANEGIYRSFTATNGGDYVLRALGHSDGTCSPQIKITRADGTTEINHLNGTTISTRTAPNVYVFTWESPAAESEQVQLLNTASSGTCYWHQVEVLANLVDNPSIETGSGDPWIPTGWSNGGEGVGSSMASGDSTREVGIVYSGSSSIKIGANTGSKAISANFPPGNIDVGTFAAHGAMIRGNGSSSLTVTSNYGGRRPLHSSIGTQALLANNSTSWIHTSSVFRGAGHPMNAPIIKGDTTGQDYLDDIYTYRLNDVSLTVTPASQANSTEASGVRVDGGDSLTQSISTGVAASTGLVKFNFTPRHSFADAAKFGVANPVIAHVYGDATNYLKLYYQSSTILRLTGVFNGTTVNADYSTPTLNAGTTYEFEISYTSGGNLVLRVDGTQRAAQSGVVAFTTVPTTVYWGTDNAGGNSNPYDGTYAAPSATTLSASALATNEKVFSGGYKTTNTVASAGLYQDITTTGGADYVVRGLAHSDGTCVPRITLYDQTGGAEIGQLDGTTASTRTAPNAVIFTGEMPGSGTKTLRVKLMNTANTGTCYWHQVEVLANTFDNPSMETGGSDPWVLTGYSNVGLTTGQALQKTSGCNSGTSCLIITGTMTNVGQSKSGFSASNGFYSDGVWGKTIAGSLCLGSPGYSKRNDGSDSWPSNAACLSGSESYIKRVHNYLNGGYNALGVYAWYGGLHDGYFDDAYIFKLNDVSLTITPANQANSTEASGLRVDGYDSLTQPITGLSTSSGEIRFKYTPRHSSANWTSFGGSYAGLFSASNGSNEFIWLRWVNANTIEFNKRVGGTDYASNLTVASIVAGTTYNLKIIYDSTSVRFYINDVLTGTVNNGTAFSNVLTIADWGGSYSSLAFNTDATYSNFVALTPTENSTSPYYKFGSKSAKLVNAGDQPDEYTISINPASTATHTLSAYVYNGTTGAVGGTVDATVAKMVFNGVAVTPASYTDMGGGWWRLTYSTVTVNQAGLYGVQALAGKTIYVDGVQMEAKAYATTYADGSLDTTGKYDWTGTANNSSSGRTATDVAYSSLTGLSQSSGSIQYWVKLPQLINGDTHMFSYLKTSGGLSSVATNIISNVLRTVVYDSSGTYKWYNSTITPTAGRWAQITSTWDNGTNKVFVNGVDTTGSVVGSGTGIPRDMANGILSIASSSNGVMTDLRIFNKALSVGEVANLYYEGLSSHASSTESDDRYDSGVKTYTSPVIDLGANGQWGDIPFDITTALHGGTVNYFTRTSADNSTWTDWSSVAGSVIASDPRRYMQWKADMSASADQSDTSVISGLTVRYIEDTTPPVNPADVALGFANEASTSATLVSGDFANHARPKFTWEEALDAAGNGQSASGVASYRMLLSTDVNSTPSAHLADPCYVETSPTTRSFVVGTSPSTCTLTDNTWYLRLQSKDNSGNVSDPSTIFVYKYDGTAPRAPASVSSTTIGYSADNAFTFFWPSANDDGQHQSGIIYYQYKTGAEDGTYSEWRSSNAAGDPLVTEVSNVEAYQQGQNFFFVRSVDLAGNVSASTTNVGVAPFYYNSDAPTAPTNLQIVPATSESTPATANIFTVTWDKPSSYSGEIAKYYYCVNCTPGATTMTETTAAETVNRTLEDIALATQQGKNTFYIVAEDNNVNTSTGFGNRNFEAYEHADFYTLTVAPGAPQDLSISDASSRTASLWRLTLSWKAPATGGTPARYEIFRSSDDGATYTNQGNTSTIAYTDSDLTQGKKYYYKIRAVDNAGSVSLFTSVVNLSPEGKYVEPPSAGGVPSVSTGSTTATVTWTTDRSSYGTIEYGKTSSYGSAGTETVATAKHSIKFTGLVPGTEYHYRVQSLDESALVGYDRSSAYSEDYSFTTLSTPTISKVEVSDQTLESAVITWLSANLTSADIEYGETTAYGKTLEVSVGTAEATHSVKVNDLTHSTTYHFRIKGVDVDENDIVSDDYTFQTIIFPKFTAMVLNTDQGETGTAVVLGWVSNVPTTGTLEYQPVKVDPEYAKKAKDNLSSPEVLLAMTQDELASIPVIPVSAVKKLAQTESVLQHVERISDLEDGAIYVITVRGRDAYGNEVVSDPIRYVTGADTRPPQMKNLIFETPISGTGPEATVQIIVSWETDEPSIGQVAWGEGSGSEYSQLSEKEEGMATKHVIVLRELRPTTSYHLKVISTDRMKNASESEDTVVVTPSAQEAAFDVIIKNLEDIFGFLKL